MERNDLLNLVLQFLEKENYKETLHSLERESRVFFNLRYFEEKVIQGEWDELENGDKMNALKILRDDLNVFAVFDTLYFKKTAGLMGLDNIREAPHLSNYVDAQTARASFLNKLRTLIMENPLLRDKLQLPTLPEGSLHTMINQSLNWQHLHCENSVEVPIIRTLFVDHACEQLNDDQPLSPEVNNVNSSDNIPNTVVANLSQGSSV
nr:topless-related protein 3-like isoform X1 [Ipomoea batatas]